MKLVRILIYIIIVTAITACSNKKVEPETTVVNLEIDSYDVYIGRSIDKPVNMLTAGIKPGEQGWIGNPHPIGWCEICQEEHTRKECIIKFKRDFLKKVQSDPEFNKSVLELKHKRLGCYCKPQDCHGDVIKEWLDSQ